jgi:hypothetical protein
VVKKFKKKLGLVLLVGFTNAEKCSIIILANFFDRQNFSLKIRNFGERRELVTL